MSSAQPRRGRAGAAPIAMLGREPASRLGLAIFRRTPTRAGHDRLASRITRADHRRELLDDDGPKPLTAAKPNREGLGLLFTLPGRRTVDGRLDRARSSRRGLDHPSGHGTRRSGLPGSRFGRPRSLRRGCGQLLAVGIPLDQPAPRELLQPAAHGPEPPTVAEPSSVSQDRVEVFQGRALRPVVLVVGPLAGISHAPRTRTREPPHITFYARQDGAAPPGGRR